MQELSVVPAEIIKMLALVGFKLIMNKVGSINAGNRTTDSSSVGRTPTAVMVAEGGRRFKSCLSDYQK